LPRNLNAVLQERAPKACKVTAPCTAQHSGP
jgi:hypothetical protein